MTKPNLPQRGTTVLAYTGAQERNVNLSPERKAIEKLIAKARAPLTTAEIAEAVGVDRTKATRYLQNMLRQGQVTYALCTVTKRRLYEPATQAKKAAAAAPLRYCNSTQPKLASLPSMQPARAGAMDHLHIKSRRGDELVGHQPPMLIGSGIGGGMQ